MWEVLVSNSIATTYPNIPTTSELKISSAERSSESTSKIFATADAFDLVVIGFSSEKNRPHLLSMSVIPLLLRPMLLQALQIASMIHEYQW